MAELFRSSPSFKAGLALTVLTANNTMREKSGVLNEKFVHEHISF